MNRHFLKAGRTSIFNLPAVRICALFATIAAAHAQIRTVTQQPYPTGGNSVAWITNVPFVDGGGPEQQLDLYMPTEIRLGPWLMIDRAAVFGRPFGTQTPLWPRTRR